MYGTVNLSKINTVDNETKSKLKKSVGTDHFNIETTSYETAICLTRKRKSVFDTMMKIALFKRYYYER